VSHTPGPWRAAIYGRHEIYEIEVPTKPFGKLIAKVHFGFNEPFESQQHANAKLIAAAPDLLTALKAVVAISDRKHDAWDAAHAAIAKAEGRS
jgi:hypothetical protein